MDALRSLWPLKSADRGAEAPRSTTRRRRLARGTEAQRSSAESARARDDMRQAREIQLRFLPAVPESLAGVQMLAEYRPAFDIGGDFYDLVQTDVNRFTVVMGDVSGKGVSAALIMSRIMVEFRRAAYRRLGPAEILREVNQFLVEQAFEEGFVTATCVEVDVHARTLAVANAGHVPLFVRHSDGATHTFGDASGAPLGLVDGETYRTDTLAFEPHDIVLLVTDGVTEALEPEADPSTGVVAGLIAASGHDIRTLARSIMGSVAASPERHPADDIALFAMHLA